MQVSMSLLHQHPHHGRDMYVHRVLSCKSAQWRLSMCSGQRGDHVPLCTPHPLLTSHAEQGSCIAILLLTGPFCPGHPQPWGEETCVSQSCSLVASCPARAGQVAPCSLQPPAGTRSSTLTFLLYVGSSWLHPSPTAKLKQRSPSPARHGVKCAALCVYVPAKGIWGWGKGIPVFWKTEEEA